MTKMPSVLKMKKIPFSVKISLISNYIRNDMLDNIDEANPVLFDIKHSVITALRENQFFGRETEDCNAHLTQFLEACNTIRLKPSHFNLSFLCFSHL